jgi:hypothetical protein
MVGYQSGAIKAFLVPFVVAISLPENEATP